MKNTITNLYNLDHSLIPLMVHSEKNWNRDHIRRHELEELKEATGLKLINGTKTKRGYINTLDFDFKVDPFSGHPIFLEMLQVIGYPKFKTLDEAIEGNTPFEVTKSGGVHFFFYSFDSVKRPRKGFLLEYMPWGKKEIELLTEEPVTISPTVIKDYGEVKDYCSKNGGILEAPVLNPEQIKSLLNWLESKHDLEAEGKSKSTGEGTGESLEGYKTLESIEYTHELKKIDEILKEKELLEKCIEGIGLKIQRVTSKRIEAFSWRFDPLILGLISLFCAFYAATLNSSDSFPLYFS